MMTAEAKARRQQKDRERYMRHREEKLKRQHAYYHSHAEERKQYQKQYYREHREDILYRQRIGQL